MHDADALLCENCGYGLSGLDPSGVCPECAAPIARSIPSRSRPGSAWQAERSIRPLFRTIAHTLRHPIGSWNEVRIVRVRASFTQSLVMLFAAVMSWWVVMGVFVIVMVLLHAPSHRPQFIVGTLKTQFAFAATAMLVLTAIVAVQTSVVRYLGRQRGWRDSGEVAWVLVAHACAGWMVSPLLLGATLLVSVLSQELFRLRGVTLDVLRGVFAAGYYGHPFVAFLVFETLVFVGQRQLRFVNSHGAK